VPYTYLTGAPALSPEPCARVRPACHPPPDLSPSPYAATWANLGACVPKLGNMGTVGLEQGDVRP
jgi:hypothetical protein